MTVTPRFSRSTPHDGASDALQKHGKNFKNKFSGVLSAAEIKLKNTGNALRTSFQQPPKPEIAGLPSTRVSSTSQAATPVPSLILDNINPLAYNNKLYPDIESWLAQRARKYGGGIKKATPSVLSVERKRDEAGHVLVSTASVIQVKDGTTNFGERIPFSNYFTLVKTVDNITTGQVTNTYSYYAVADNRNQADIQFANVERYLKNNRPRPDTLKLFLDNTFFALSEKTPDIFQK